MMRSLASRWSTCVRAYVPTPLPVLSDALDLWSRKLAADVIGLPSRASVQSRQ